MKNNKYYLVCSMIIFLSLTFSLLAGQNPDLKNPNTDPNDQYPVFVSVDIIRDQLVRIDPNENSVEPVGNWIGFNAVEVDLASVNNEVFALNGLLNGASHVYSVNTETGYAEAANRAFSLGLGEGLASIGNRLVAVLDQSADGRANVFREVDITDPILSFKNGNLVSLSSDLDCDGLGSYPGVPELCCLDVQSSNAQNLLYRVQLDQQDYHLQTQVDYFSSNRSLQFNDIATTEHLQIYGLSSDGLYKIDRIDGQVISVMDIPEEYRLAGLAIAAYDSVPPTTCPGDLNFDETVNGTDLSILLGKWGSDDELADLTQNSIVNAADLAELLSYWGDCN